MGIANNKNASQAAGYGPKKEYKKRVDWPVDVWCAKCQKTGWLPVAYFNPKATRVLTGVAACDCKWGDARKQQSPKIGLYYAYPSDLIDREAQTWRDIWTFFKQTEERLLDKLYERMGNEEEETQEPTHAPY